MSVVRQLAVVTGASSGIGLELARLCAERNFDVIIAADEPAIESAAKGLTLIGADITPVQCDLGTQSGVLKLFEVIERTGRPVDALLANAGRGLGGAFLDQDIAAALHVVRTNVDGTLHLIHLVAQGMRTRRRGRILITGAVSSVMPGTFQAVYNATKGFLDSFAAALGNELKDTGVTVTCLLPGATDTQFFARAGMLDTKVAADDSKADPIDVAQTGFDAMMKGENRAVHGFTNKLRVAAARIAPNTVLAELQRGAAAPGTANPTRTE